MSRSLVRMTSFIVMLVLASWLFIDAATFSLYKADPIIGRGRACYTQLEILMGAKRPLDWIRAAEFGAATILLGTGVALIASRKSK